MNVIRFFEICWEDFNHVLWKTPPTISREVRRRERRCQRNPREWFNQLEDKSYARDWVGDLGVRAPRLYFQSKLPEDLPAFEDLPPRVVLKPTLGASMRGVFILDHGVNRFDQRPYTREEVIECWNSDTKIRNNPQVTYTAEELIFQEGHPETIAWDYKFYVFGEQIAMIFLVRGRDEPGVKNFANLFDEHWDPIDQNIYPTTLPGPYTPPPECFEEMKDFVKRLGRELNCFMRIDMFASDQGAVFGEFTPFAHGKGRWTPEIDQHLGAMWQGKEGVA